MMIVVRHHHPRNVGLTIQIFSDPTEVPLIAANRSRPSSGPYQH